MLTVTKLQNSSHRVLTGLSVFSTKNDELIVEFDQTKVYLREINNKEIINYVETGEPLDKAGAYGIQGKGGIFVEKIIGSYYTVVGLPVHKLALILKKYSINLL